MYDDSSKTVFYRAPQSVSAFIATLVEPLVAVLMLVLAHLLLQPPGVNRAGIVVLAMLTFALHYPGRNRLRMRPSLALTDIIGHWILVLLILLAFGFAVGALEFFDQRTLLVWAAATPIAQALTLAATKRWVAVRGADPELRRRAVVVGAGSLGAKVASSLADHHEFGCDFLGYFDDRADDRLPEETTVRRLGQLKDVGEFAKANRVTDVFITLPLVSQARIMNLLQELQDTTASMYFVPDVFSVDLVQGRLRDVNGLPVVGLGESPFAGTAGLAKRSFDIIVGGIFTLVMLPWMALAAIGVRLSSPGPMIERAARESIHGDALRVLRFRTRTGQGENARPTPLGAFLEHTGLDRLPQLFQVLAGSMSLVGPQALTPETRAAYRDLVSTYMVRHPVRPGLTGWAQINGNRISGESGVPAEDTLAQRVSYDMEYLRNWSVALDVQILLRSVRMMIAGRKPA